MRVSSQIDKYAVCTKQEEVLKKTSFLFFWFVFLSDLSSNPNVAGNSDDSACAVHLGGDDFQFHGSNPVDLKLKIGPEPLVLISSRAIHPDLLLL